MYRNQKNIIYQSGQKLFCKKSWCYLNNIAFYKNKCYIIDRIDGDYIFMKSEIRVEKYDELNVGFHIKSIRENFMDLKSLRCSKLEKLNGLQ